VRLPGHLTTPRLKHEAWRANPKRVGYKLTIDAVHEIRHGPYDRRRLARKYDISEWYVWVIRSGYACPNIASPLLVEPSKEKEKREARSFVERNPAILDDIRQQARARQ